MINIVLVQKPKLPVHVIGLHLLLSFVLNSCNFSSPTLTPIPSPWLSEFLLQRYCDLPCWVNISPGQTDLVKAKSLLQDYSEIAEFKGPQSGFAGELNFLWQFRSSQSSGQLVVDETSLLVKRIDFCFSKSEKPTIQTMVSAFGSPSHVIVMRTSESQTFFSAQILYRQSGMALEVSIESMSTFEVEINPEQKIYCITLFPIGFDETVIDSAYIGQLIDWNGYSRYPVAD